MSEIKSNRQTWGKDFPIGGEWDAGATTPLWPTYPAGLWTVRWEAEGFVVVFHRFMDRQETLLEPFPPTEQGEIDAKACALVARDNLRFS
ncbi:MAG: hypothetical protein ABSB41_02120 [Anaerolineales bacterium]|jgi:hypothetical protein